MYCLCCIVKVLSWEGYCHSVSYEYHYETVSTSLVQVGGDISLDHEAIGICVWFFLTQCMACWWLCVCVCVCVCEDERGHFIAWHTYVHVYEKKGLLVMKCVGWLEIHCTFTIIYVSVLFWGHAYDTGSQRYSIYFQLLLLLFVLHVQSTPHRQYLMCIRSTSRV